MAGDPLLVAAVVSGCLLMGGLMSLLFGLSQQAREHVGLPENKRIWLSVCFTAAMIFGMFFSGLLINGWALGDVLILSALLGGFSIALLGLSGNYRMGLGAAAAMGAAAGMLHTAVAVAMPLAFFSMDDAPAATNLGYVFVVLGALAAPFLGRLLVKQIGFRNGMLALALLSLLPAACATLADKQPFDAVKVPTELEKLFGDLRFWLAAGGVFFYEAVEISAAQWAGNYLTELGFTNRYRAAILVGFWAIFLAARLVCTTLHGYTVFAAVLLALTFLSAAVLGNLTGFFNRTSGTFTLLLLAACVGPVFPTLVGLIFLTFHKEVNPAVAFGAVFALGSVGRLIAEPVMASQVRRGHTRVAMGITLVMLLVIAVPALVLLVLPPS